MIDEFWKLPVAATALLADPTFVILPMRQCEIFFCIEGSDGAPVKISLIFDGVEAFRCTYLTSCSAEMFSSAYGKLVSLKVTPWLIELLKTHENSKRPSKDFKHMMICFDDGPCYEFICLSFSVNEEVKDIK
ncbi:hypothetical protein [Rhodanobacter sp. C03]|uniref:hypothetical protein n=1 Tax=Rhodanobacter sp. C03 TaxID=1945858 RepID=UPI001115642F|nr:hypothetical protein [Rhodanobacter sp. C03]